MCVFADDDPSGKEFICKTYELLRAFFGHVDVRIIIPGQKSPMPYRADHAAACKIKIYTVPGADIVDLFK